MQTPVCLICVRSYKNATSRDTHGYTAHGSPSSRWKGWAEAYPHVTFERVAPGHRKPHDKPAPRAVPVTLADRDHSTRSIPKKEDWNQADGLDALPWVKYPKTPEEANSVASLLGKLASTIPTNRPEHAIILSQRDYYLAFGARLRRQKAVA